MMEQITFNFPFQKINKQKRIVTGIATADNIDHSMEQVDFQGSLDAFNNWMGNIREMHGKDAVGKAVGFRPVTVWYKGQQYRGIEVDAYISKGAPHTWEKVLDGTLSGFSIGGAVIEKIKQWNKDIGAEITLIKKYFLGELSLVDNPDNPAATLSLIKSVNGHLEVGETIEKTKFNIFYCEEDHIAKADSDECSYCSNPMIELGSVDEFDVENISLMIEKVTNAHKSPPKGYPQDKSQYADPANYKYPIDEAHLTAALTYYNHEGQQGAGGYSSEQWSAIGGRIVAALNRRGDKKYHLEGGKIVSSSVEKAAEMPEDHQHMMGDGGMCKVCGEDMKKAVKDEEDGEDTANDPSEGTEDSEDESKTKADDKIKKNLQNKDADDTVENMELSTDQKVSVSKMILKWLGFTDDAEKVEKSVAVEAVVEAEAEVVDETKDENNNGGLELDINDIAALLDDRLAKMRDDLKTEISAEIDTKVDAISKSVETVKEEVESVSTKVETIDESTAMKKSVDKTEDEADEKIEKSVDTFWGGVFVPLEISNALGYDS